MDEMPLFVKLDQYNEALSQIEAIRKKVNEAHSTLHQIEELKNEEDAELERWKVSLESIDEKIDTINQALTLSDNE